VGEMVPADILGVARQTYELEVSMDSGPHLGALDKAITAGMLVYERQIVGRIISILEATQAEMDTEGDMDGAAGVEQILIQVRGLVSQQNASEYLPHQDDLVEIVLCGRVHIAEDRCQHCGHTDGALWSLYDYRTGAEYYFDQAEVHNNLNVRVVSRAEEE
jgi:hypothetical protein